MKFVHCILFSCLAVSCASCQDRSAFKVTLSTIDNMGKPIDGANIETDVFDGWQAGDGFGRDVYKKFKMETGSVGTVEFEGSTSRCEMVFHARKQGYYWAGTEFRSTTRSNDRWQPWNPTLALIMWNVQNPIPLMAKKVTRDWVSPVQLPAFGRPVGYDFEVGDWVAPYGRGRVGDLLFQLDGQTTNLGGEYDTTLRIEFSHAKDGFILIKPIEGSELKMPYLAPTDGYRSNLIRRQSRIKDGIKEFPVRDKIIEDKCAEDYYFFRVRTIVDEDGNIVSANYAKVQRGFEWFVSGEIKFQYHFNPTPNDRNLEFDPKRNLLKLPEEHRVTEP